jgi:hypothetical protein
VVWVEGDGVEWVLVIGREEGERGVVRGSGSWCVMKLRGIG